METYSGKIKRVKFRNDTNGWSVLEMQDGNTVVGSPAFASEDLEITCEGEWTDGGKFGRQFKAKTIRIKNGGSDEKAALIALLGGGFLKGVKTVMARQIAGTFGSATFDKLDASIYDPSVLQQVKGIGKVNYKRVVESWRNQRGWARAALVAVRAGLTMRQAKEAYSLWGNEIIEIINDNPYLLTIIDGVTWARADEIATLEWPGKSKIEHDDPRRYGAAVREVLRLAYLDGHMALLEIDALTQARELAKPTLDGFDDKVRARYGDDKLVLHDVYLYSHPYWKIESETARMVFDRLRLPFTPPKDYELIADITMSPDQEAAVKLAIEQHTVVVTGGPGVGKCQPGHVLVETSDGLVRLDSLVPSWLGEDRFAPAPVNSVSSYYGEARASLVYNGGVKPTTKIVTSSGFETTGTHEHPVMIITKDYWEWKQMKDVKPGDWIALSMQPPCARTDFLSEECAWMCGALLADGGLSQGVVIYTKNHNGMRHRMADLSSKYLDARPVEFCNHGVSALRLNGQPGVFQKLSELGISKGLSADKHVPYPVMHSGARVRAAFVSGLFDGDGSFVNNKIEWSSASPRMAREVQIILASLKVWSRRRTKVINSKEYHILTVSGGDVDTYFAVVGFPHSNKGDKYQCVTRNTNTDVVPGASRMIRSVFTAKGKRTRKEWYAWKKEINGTRNPSRARIHKLLEETKCDVIAGTDAMIHWGYLKEVSGDGVRWDVVTKVLDDGEQQVYDLVVPTAHCFVSDGFHVHNSSITKVICDTLAAAGKSITLCAPTGKAARRLSEATGRHAATLHRTLMIGASGAREQFATDVVVIDECSMIDAAIMHTVLKATPARTKLILVGDVDQLPPVGAGEPFYQIIQVPGMPVGRLTQVHRQAADSGIVATAHAFRVGAVPDTSQYSDTFIEYLGQNEELPDAAVRRMQECLTSGWSLDDMQVITPVNGHAWGQLELNERLQARFNPGPFPNNKGIPFKVGDKVVHTKNIYGMGEKMQVVLNGMTGKVVWVMSDYEEARETLAREESGNSDMPIVVKVLFDGETGITEYTRPDLFHLKLAWALTGHKLQGSECPCAVILVPRSHPNMMTRQWVYTAETRAKREVHIFSAGSAIDRYVGNEERVRRTTFLADLTEILQVEARDEA